MNFFNETTTYGAVFNNLCNDISCLVELIPWFAKANNRENYPARFDINALAGILLRPQLPA